MPVSAVWAIALILMMFVPAHAVAQQADDAGGQSTPLLQIRVAYEQDVAGAQPMELAGEVLFVADEIVVQDTDIEFLHVFWRTEDELRVRVELTEAGTLRLRQVTEDHVGDRLGVFVRSRLVSAPRVLTPLALSNGVGFLALPIAEDEADSVAEALNARFGGSFEAFLARRPPPPPPIAPPGATQIDPADRPGVLIAAAAYLRNQWSSRSVEGDSAVVDVRYRDTAADGLPDPNDSPGSLLAGELELLQRELRAGTGTLESVQTNCRPLFGCELTVSRFFTIGRPVLRTDGTVTMNVEVRFRTSSTWQPTAFSSFVLVLTRTGDTWTARGSCPCVAT